MKPYPLVKSIAVFYNIIIILFLSTFHFVSAQLNEKFDNEILKNNFYSNHLIFIENSDNFLTTFSHVFWDETIVIQDDQIAESLGRCYFQLREGQQELHVDDLIIVLPFLLTYVNDQDLNRAPREDVQSINSAISGCCNGCDSGQIIALLNAIKKLIINCCEDINIDFQATWSILANLTFNVTATVDLSGVYTALNACCNGTFTAISEVKNTLTVCCANINQEFQATWSILNAIQLTQTVDLSGVYTSLNACCNSTFTAIADVKNTLTACCATINREFQETWTILSNINLNVTATVDLSPVLTALAACCNGTFTALNDIKTTITECCAGTFTAISAGLNGTFSVLKNLEYNNCNPVYFGQADVGTAGYTINTAGVYKLKENVTFSPVAAARAVTVNASDVLLDLQCFMIQQGNTTANIDAIRVNSGFVDVTIQNGMVQAFTRAGFTIQSNTARTNILNTSAVNCAIRGIELLGPTSGTPTIVNLTIDNVDVINSCTFAASGNNGLLFQGTQDLQVNNCRINNNGVTTQNFSVIKLDNCLKCALNDIEANDNLGLGLNVYELNFTSSACTLKNCSNKNNIATGNARGFNLISNSSCSSNQFIGCESVLLSGSAAVDGFLTDTGCNNNVFINCKAFVNTTTGSDSLAVVHGFNFINNQKNSCIDCIALSNQASSSTASPFGAFGFDLNTTSSSNLIRCVATDQLTGASSSSVGFRIFNGAKNNIFDCQSARHNVGYQIDPTNSVDHVFSRNIAVQNTVSSYSGFIAGSIQSATNMSNIVGNLTVPWSNVSVN